MLVLLALAGAATVCTAQQASAQQQLFEAHASLAEALAALADPAALRAGSDGSGVGFGPRLAPVWKARVVSGSGLMAGEGVYLHDGAGQRWRSNIRSNITIFHEAGEEMVMDTLASKGPGFANNMTVGEGSGAVCKAMPGEYYDQFAVLGVAKHRGTGSVGGEPCELWAGSLDMPGRHLTVSACIAADGVPRAFNMTTGLAYKVASAIQYVFSNVSVAPLSDADFLPSGACESHYPMPPCPGAEEVALDLYRVHSAKEPLTLENRNLGDALGDMAFFCDIAGMDDSQMVTKFEVKANASWGQYAYCLYAGGKNVCFGHTGKHVGREGALGFGDGDAQGQCSTNAQVGSWFSFPAEGECASGAALGTGDCTWKAQAGRTISAKCVLTERGLRASCAQERGHAPMLKSATIFAAALASADPSKGGCPDVELQQQEFLVV